MAWPQSKKHDRTNLCKDRRRNSALPPHDRSVLLASRQCRHEAHPWNHSRSRPRRSGSSRLHHAQCPLLPPLRRRQPRCHCLDVELQLCQRCLLSPGQRPPL
ncbi:uncharacterized protein DS421_15g499630 [Arachis hypogaea]|nr:uncharacterized protein DS421_15g499630 [Arachis hypogaea]